MLELFWKNDSYDHFSKFTLRFTIICLIQINETLNINYIIQYRSIQYSLLKLKNS